MHRIIVNSTPLIILCNVGRVDILQKLYGQIVIPEAVYEEVTAKKDSACQQLVLADWIHVERIKEQTAKKMYQAKLHDGEVEVMILAQEDKNTELVIIDDNAAKKTAKYLGLNVTGTLGVLLKAKRMGIIKEVSPIISEMRKKGFYVSGYLERIILEQAGELTE